jgi:5-methylcytosine-specific restriction endonuclease McrA
VLIYELDCFNCGDRFSVPKRSLSGFCCTWCRDVASVVRYARGTMSDGRYEDQPDVRDAIKIKVAHVLGGVENSEWYERNHGAPRKIPPAVRAAVMGRDQGRCVKCGDEGTEVDHIRDGKPSLDNLQLLCKSCHRNKTSERLRPGDTLTERQELAWLDIMTRIQAPQALTPCDGSAWAESWRRSVMNIAQVDDVDVEQGLDQDLEDDDDFGAYDPGDYDGGFGPNSYFAHSMLKD